jgi:hypothetical protein
VLERAQMAILLETLVELEILTELAASLVGEI